MPETPSLNTLATEVLLYIFHYLDKSDLGRLRTTCRRFHAIIEDCKSLFKKYSSLIATEDDNLIIQRSFKELPNFQRHRLSYNWRHGIAVQRSYLPRREIFLPWLHIDDKVVWISRGYSLAAYKRSIEGISPNRPVQIIYMKNKQDICHFVVKGKYLVAGQTEGNLFMWSVDKKKLVFNVAECHMSDIDAVDMCEDIIVSGSRDGSVKLWRHEVNDEHIQQRYTGIIYSDRVWSVALNNKDFLAVGTSGINADPIIVFDIEVFQVVKSIKGIARGAGAKFIRWESPQTFWSCGYDSCVRRWDLRTEDPVQVMEDPLNSTVYCFDTDYKYSLVSGCQGDGRVVLWDVRQTSPLGFPLQFYFMENCTGMKTSPVYCVAYDPCYLYAASAHYLTVHNFNGNEKRGKDYSDCIFNLLNMKPRI